MKYILILEDDADLAAGMEMALMSDDFSFTICSTIKEAEEKFRQQTFDLLILDVNLPDGDGLSFARRVRKKGNLPVIFLTAKDMDEDVMRGFETGADDYVTKPFNVQILIQRVRAVLGRYRAGTGGNGNGKTMVRTGNLEIDFDSWMVRKNGEELILTPTEFRLLKKFCENQGIVLTREILMEELWDREGNYVDEHTLTIFISRLRSKIADDTYTYIKTIYGTGYKWIGD